LDPEPSLIIASQVDFVLLLRFSIIFILLFWSAIISGAEVALLSLTKKEIEDALQVNQTKAQMLFNVIDNPKKVLKTLLIAKTILNVAIIILFFYVLNGSFIAIESAEIVFFVKLVLVTFLLLLFGEVLPKIYAIRNRISFALLVIYPISILHKIVLPIALPLHFLTRFLENKWIKQKSNFSVDQLSQALDMTNSDETPLDEQKILEGIVSFGNTDTKQVMSPRIDVFALEITEPFELICAKIIEKGFSRIPVYKENIDQIEGVLIVKDLLPYITTNNFDWASLIKAPFFVPENKKLDDLLKDFQNMKSHLAIVVDEYGGTSGLVTLEDVIEEIVGDISDEFDSTISNYVKIDDKNYIFEAKINLKDFFRIIEVDEELFETKKGEAETLAGFILEILGNFPNKDQIVSVENCTFVIESVDQKRIKQVKVTLE